MFVLELVTLALVSITKRVVRWQELFHLAGYFNIVHVRGLHLDLYDGQPLLVAFLLLIVGDELRHIAEAGRRPRFLDSAPVSVERLACMCAVVPCFDQVVKCAWQLLCRD